MDDSPLTARQRRKRNILGRLLIEGPRAILPPKNIDEDGWLEPVLFIRERSCGWTVIESVMLLCDSTMNRDRSFLTPMIRQALWEREKDLDDKDSLYPHVQIKLGMASDWNAVKRIGRRIQRSLLSPPFIVYGHSKTRSVPRIETSCTGAEYLVRTDNGLQSIEFSSVELDSDPVSSVLRESKTTLRSLVMPIDPVNWRERYNYNLPSQTPQESWDWIVGRGFLDDWDPIS